MDDLNSIVRKLKEDQSDDNSLFNSPIAHFFSDILPSKFTIKVSVPEVQLINSNRERISGNKRFFMIVNKINRLITTSKLRKLSVIVSLVFFYEI